MHVGMCTWMRVPARLDTWDLLEAGGTGSCELMWVLGIKLWSFWREGTLNYLVISPAPATPSFKQVLRICSHPNATGASALPTEPSPSLFTMSFQFSITCLMDSLPILNPTLPFKLTDKTVCLSHIYDGIKASWRSNHIYTGNNHVD